MGDKNPNLTEWLNSLEDYVDHVFNESGQDANQTAANIIQSSSSLEEKLKPAHDATLNAYESALRQHQEQISGIGNGPREKSYNGDCSQGCGHTDYIPAQYLDGSPVYTSTGRHIAGVTRGQAQMAMDWEKRRLSGGWTLFLYLLIGAIVSVSCMIALTIVGMGG